MATAAEIQAAIYRGIEELNHELPEDRQLACAPETPLLGEASGLESLDLVTLLVEVEQALADSLGVRVTIADEDAMSRKRSPFRTVATLAEFLGEKLGDA